MKRGARRRTVIQQDPLHLEQVMEITFTDLQNKVHLNSSQIIRIIKSVLRYEKIKTATLSVVFVNYQRMTALNKQFLNRYYATDVLAFDMRDDEDSARKPKAMAGDIIISTDAALKHTRTSGSGLADELALYLVHGILHLLGYDDHSPADVKRMREKEREVLSYLGGTIDKMCRMKA